MSCKIIAIFFSNLLTQLQIDIDHSRNLTYQNKTIKQLESLIPEFEWRRYIQGIFNDVENVTITENEVILVEDFKYLSEAAKLYSTQAKSNLK